MKKSGGAHMLDNIYQVMRVTERIPEGKCGATLVLDGELPCQAGQFVMVWLPGVEERPFTLVNDTPVTLTVAAIGPLTRALAGLEVGARVWLRGPYGHGFPPPGRRLLVLGGGSGIASLALLARRALAEGAEVRTYIGARTTDLLMLPWYPHWSTLTLTTDDGSQGIHGNVLQAAAEQFAWADGIYACGPEPMLAALARSRRSDWPPCWINLERVMRCGIGVCGSCHCGSHLVCADGPVFNLEQVTAELLAPPH